MAHEVSCCPMHGSSYTKPGTERSNEAIVAEEHAPLHFSNDMSYGDYLHIDLVL